VPPNPFYDAAVRSMSVSWRNLSRVLARARPAHRRLGSGVAGLHGVAGFVCFPRDQLGTVVAVIALMTACANIVAALGWVLALDESLNSWPVLVTVQLAALLAITLAGWLITPAESTLTEDA
jgi:hypothetical protein